MTQKIKLSLCIPTYNRASCLDVLLDSIADQIEDSVEVVISDNASNDHTKEVVQKWQEKLPHLTYFCQEENQGFDQNCLQVCMLARGEYCWIIGSDDALTHGAIEKALQMMEENPHKTGFTCKSIPCTKDLIPKIKESVGAIETQEYLSGAEALDAIGIEFTFISSHIFSRQKWMEFAGEHSERYYAYVHFGIFCKMLHKYGNWLETTDPYIYARGNNSSAVTDHGFSRWFAIEMGAYQNAILDAFKEDGQARYDRFLPKTFSPYFKWKVIEAKLHGSPLRVMRKMFFLCLKEFSRYPSFWTRVFPYFLIPGKTLVALRALKRSFKPVGGKR